MANLDRLAKEFDLAEGISNDFTENERTAKVLQEIIKQMVIRAYDMGALDGYMDCMKDHFIESEDTVAQEAEKRG